VAYLSSVSKKSEKKAGYPKREEAVGSRSEEMKAKVCMKSSETMASVWRLKPEMYILHK